jgi:hypothetical protein
VKAFVPRRLRPVSLEMTLWKVLGGPLVLGLLAFSFVGITNPEVLNTTVQDGQLIHLWKPVEHDSDAARQHLCDQLHLEQGSPGANANAAARLADPADLGTLCAQFDPPKGAVR